MDISIIIVNYNTYRLTTNCINSIIEFTTEVEYEIILVDNGSKENEPILFEQLFPHIKVLRLNKNLGFAKGNNVALPFISGKYILLLNSDTILKENSIRITYNYLEAHSNVGCVSARLIFPDGRHQSVAQRFPSIRYTLAELLRFQKIFPRFKKLLLGSFFSHSENAKVDWVWGAYFMFPRKILSQFPGQKLDDGYFMYAEDMQWCYDIKKAGYEVHFCAETEVIHIMGGSSGAKKELMQNNNEIFLKRNYSPMHRLIIKGINKMLV